MVTPNRNLDRKLKRCPSNMKHEKSSVLSVGQLMWLRFRKNKPAVSAVVFSWSSCT